MCYKISLRSASGLTQNDTLEPRERLGGIATYINRSIWHTHTHTKHIALYCAAISHPRTARVSDLESPGNENRSHGWAQRCRTYTGNPAQPVSPPPHKKEHGKKKNRRVLFTCTPSSLTASFIQPAMQQQEHRNTFNIPGLRTRERHLVRQLYCPRLFSCCTPLPLYPPRGTAHHETRPLHHRAHGPPPHHTRPGGAGGRLETDN